MNKLRGFATFLALSLTACGSRGSARPIASAHTHAHGHAHSHDPADHNHARGKMLMASDGTLSALLTAHLAPEGNELDIFLEERGAPRAIWATELIAAVEESSVGSRVVKFECAPANERPKGEAAGACSHFVASVPWMIRTDTLRVRSDIALEDRATSFAWRDFVPATYAHHDG